MAQKRAGRKRGSPPCWTLPFFAAIAIYKIFFSFNDPAEEEPWPEYNATDLVSVSRHNSDLRDSHKYIQTQVWGEQSFTRQRIKRFNMVENRLSDALYSIAIVCYDSANIFRETFNNKKKGKKITFF